MSLNNRVHEFERYGSAQIALHWLMLLLIVAVYACIELRGLYPKGSAIREGLKSWHFALGLVVFGLVWLRLAARLLRPAPPIMPPPPRWELRVAHAAEFAMYVFMIAMPVLGWLTLSAEGDPVPFFGLQLPALMAPNEAAAGPLEEAHETIGTIGYALVGIHAAAALAHHYIARDNTLLRILPARRRS
jgi:cytochrome b561